LRDVVRFDHLYIGGGNAADLNFPLPPDVTVVPNTDGLTGGIRLWEPIVPTVGLVPLETSPAAAPQDKATSRDGNGAAPDTPPPVSVEETSPPP
jgi:hypothetical protein